VQDKDRKYPFPLPSMVTLYILLFLKFVKNIFIKNARSVTNIYTRSINRRNMTLKSYKYHKNAVKYWDMCKNMHQKEEKNVFLFTTRYKTYFFFYFTYYQLHIYIIQYSSTISIIFFSSIYKTKKTILFDPVIYTYNNFDNNCSAALSETFRIEKKKDKSIFETLFTN